MKKFLLMSFSFGFVLSVWAQDRVVNGKVTSKEDGSTLPGVSVMLKGTSSGTSTDSEGKYSLSVPSGGGILIFSFIGLKTEEVEVGERAVIDISLEADAAQLTEVIVTAQGIEKTKNELPYSAQKVNGEDIAKVRDANFTNSLSGKVAGLQIQKNNSIGGSTNVVIRGFKSITGNNQALFVVDGVPIDNSNTNSATQQAGNGGYDYGNSAADINSDDIETVNVLKGAAATALYGSRASNGVIFITTKKGTKKGLGITLNTGVTVGVADKSTLPKYQHQYGAGYGPFYGSGPGSGFYSADINGDGVPDLVVPTTEDASEGSKFDPNLMVYQWDAFDPTSPYYGKAKPWVAAQHDPNSFWKTAISTNNSVNIDQGGEHGYFKLGYTRNDEKGIMPNSEVKKDFFNFSASYNISSKLTASAQMNFSNISGKGRYGTGYDSNNPMSSFRQWWEMNNDVYELRDAYFRTGQNVTWNMLDPIGGDTKPIYWDNIYFVRYQNYETDNRARYFGNVRLDWKITKWLSAMGRVSLDSYNEFQQERVAVGSIAASSYSRFNRSFKETNYDAMLNFSKDISAGWNIKAVLGTNIRRTTIQSIKASTNGGLVVPDFYSLSNSVNPINPPTETYSDLEVDGFYGNATVGYKKLAFIDGAYRSDRTSSLPKGHNVYGYGSISGSFVFSELTGTSRGFTNGKIRVNYAEVGATAPTSSVANYYTKPPLFGYSTTLFSVPTTYNNPNLLPERTKSFEAGVELSFLDARLGFDATYYKTNTVNQIIPLSVSVATGYNARYINAGNVQNQGFELTAFGVPVKNENFSWKIDVNWTRNRSKVLSIYTDPSGNKLQTLPLASNVGGPAGVTLVGALGSAYGQLRGTDYVYLNGQKVVDDDGYYEQTSDANHVIGNINPKWYGGVRNTFNYKNVALSFLIDVKNGGNVFSTDMYFGLSTGLYQETAGKNELGNPVRNAVADGGGLLNKGVHEDGTPNTTRVEGNDYQAFGYTHHPNIAFVYDASYVKLRELALTYNFPKSVVSKLAPLKGIDISLIGRNVWIIHKNLPYADPEDTASSGNLQGFQSGSMPNTKTYGFNLKLRF